MFRSACSSFNRLLLTDNFRVQTWKKARLLQTSPRNNVHPYISIVAQNVSKAASAIAGRLFGKWWRKLSSEQKAYYKSKYFFNPRVWAVPVSVLTVGGGVFYYTHLELTPITNRKKFVMYSDKQINQISDIQGEQELEKQKDSLLDEKHPLYMRVEKIIQKILNSNQDIEIIKSKQWTIHVVDKDILNAFVMPNGHIFVYTGLMKLISNDDQLATVLGHEISHALLKHGAEQLSRSGLINIVSVFTLFLLHAIVPGEQSGKIAKKIHDRTAEILLTLPYGRLAESEADQVGMMLMSKACFDGRESSALWHKWALLDHMKDREGQEFLDTHPDPRRRAKDLNEQLPEALKARELCKCPELKNLEENPDIILLQEVMQILKNEINERKNVETK